MDLSTSTSLSSVVLTKDISVPFLTWKSPEQPPASGQQKLSDAPLVFSMISQALLLFSPWIQNKLTLSWVFVTILLNLQSTEVILLKFHQVTESPQKWHFLIRLQKNREVLLSCALVKLNNAWKAGGRSQFPGLFL